MNTFKNLHPAVLFFYFLSVIFLEMFSFNPVFLISGFIGALLYTAVTDKVSYTFKSLIGYLLIVLIVGVTNPLFSHNGATPILFINDNRITLEAFIYGAVLGLAVSAALIWFHCFNSVFDSEKIMLLFGRISPKTALVISMSLNFVPAFIRNFKSIKAAQRSLPMSRFKRYIFSFSAVISQSLENAVITSDSMSARGYGRRKRTFYSRFRFTGYDGAYLCFILILTVVSYLPTFIGMNSFTYYPYFTSSALTPIVVSGYASFALLVLTPFLFEIKEDIKWKYSISKI